MLKPCNASMQPSRDATSVGHMLYIVFKCEYCYPVTQHALIASHFTENFHAVRHCTLQEKTCTDSYTTDTSTTAHTLDRNVLPSGPPPHARTSRHGSW